jgi:hypothetical protein
MPLIIFISLSIAQDMQIRYARVHSVDMKVIGSIETTTDQTTAPGFFTTNMKFDAPWMLGFMEWETGTIMIEGKDHILKFDAKDEEYWLVSPEDHFAPDTNSNNRRRSGDIDWRNLFLDDMSNPQIKRIEGDALETVNGYRARKWTTTISGSKLELVIEEWIADEIPLLDIFDSLRIDISGALNPYKDKKDFIKFKFSSDLIINELDTNSTIIPLNGRIIKAKLDKIGPYIKSMNFEIRELYAIPFDSLSFSIPEDYEQIKAASMPSWISRMGSSGLPSPNE